MCRIASGDYAVELLIRRDPVENGLKRLMEEPGQRKQTKTAEELAAMILQDLSKVGGCPRRGVNVTVYGMPWNAMLMFDAEAGPVRNKAEVRQFFEIIKERLQRLYELY